MSSELVSVVIPHHGTPKETQRLVDEIVQQKTSSALEVIVVDDSSPVPYPLPHEQEPAARRRVEVVRRKTNGGFAAAVNSGVAVARGEMLLVLNSDVTTTPDFVETLLEGARPFWPAVITCRVQEAFGERCMGHPWPTATGVLLEYLVPLARFHGQEWYERRTTNIVTSIGTNEPIEVDWVTGICMLLPTSEVRAVGGLDERYFMNCEEIDLQRRLHDERGLPVYVLPAPVLHHVGGGSSPSEKRAGWVLDARMRYHEKWEGGPALRNGLVAAALINLAWNSVRRLLGRDLDARLVWRAEMKRIEHAWRTRR